jgi:hypothetical protein
MKAALEIPKSTSELRFRCSQLTTRGEPCRGYARYECGSTCGLLFCGVHVKRMSNGMPTCTGCGKPTKIHRDPAR